MLQGWCSVSLQHVMRPALMLLNKSSGEISHGIFDGRPSLALRIDLPPKASVKQESYLFKEDSHHPNN